MQKTSIFAIILALVFTVACKNTKKEAEQSVEETLVETVTTHTIKVVKIALEAKNDSGVTGSIVFKEEHGTVSMDAIISGLKPGSHAIHIHQTADCSSADGKSAGGHWNPTAQPHGKWDAAEGFHKGDIGNFIADENGHGVISFSTTEWCIRCEDDTKNIIGKAIIVHAGEDDFTSQPSGAAGSRISCAGIIE